MDEVRAPQRISDLPADPRNGEWDAYLAAATSGDLSKQLDWASVTAATERCVGAAPELFSPASRERVARWT
jgi:hypothetical protein